MGRLALVLVAATVIVLYAFTVAPERGGSLLATFPALNNVPQDTLAYAERFSASFVLLGLVPFLAAWFGGMRPGAIGLRSAGKRSAALCAALIAVGGAAGFLSSFSPELTAFYPYHRRLPEMVQANGWLLFAGHSAAYLLLYYLPWEILFRGVLILPFLPLSDGSGASKVRERPGCNTHLYAVAALQAVPSALLHFGHPIAESLAAVPFGIAAGWIVVRTRSILPVLCLHAAVGISLDFFTVLRSL